MNIIIVGAGEIGRHLALSLSKAAHSIVVIEQNPAIAAELEQQIDGRVITGCGSRVSILLEAGVAECELFLSLTSNATVNLMSASMAKKFAAKQVIARVQPDVEREEWLFDYKAHFNVDHIFSSERLSAVELTKFIRNPNSLMIEEIARGRIELQQVRVHEKSEVVGKRLIDLKAPERTRVASIARGGEHFIPTATDSLAANDVVTIFGEPRKLQKLANRLQQGDGKAAKPFNVVIFGGGEYGLSVAQMLESMNCRVRIFERDPLRAQELTGLLSNTTVINTDGTYLAELEEEQVGDADFFIATGGSDEDNVMTCLQAHNLGSNACLTLIHRSDYATAISKSGRHFGLLSAVSPREATRRELERFLTEDRFHTVKKLSAGEIIETRVRKGSIVAENTVAEVEWPEGCILVGIIRGVHASVPSPGDILEPEDTIYAVVTPKSRRKFLKLVR
ncbi:Trk system potassium transporter TrkA [Persicirhabdus sediminis]|uniref:Trk system potassium uptake protein TrkA n=1 Tax=Persicirhabdus sediminis TaxID=454144 RepID=A0A8J7MCB0_9BACT|nr:Trk system potassium transporter TrkA [Persicirhabdus sediminis]MBK1789958.1 Trk system potassium transporter TrkA [Persicirhabdus sediminis]